MKASLPKPRNYPKRILTIGDELRKERIDRNLTQYEVAQIIKVNRNFIYEHELNQRELTIFALHKISLFLGYIPKTLRVDVYSLQGRLYAYRILNGYPYQVVAEKIGVDKGTLAHFERGGESKPETLLKIQEFFK